jgi:hypothetical protein
MARPNEGQAMSGWRRTLKRDVRLGTVLGLALVGASLVLGGLGCQQAPQTEIAIELPADVPEGLLLKWDRVRGADGYRMVFKRMTGAAVCTVFVAGAKHPEFLIRRVALPDGLMHGWQLDMEMQAMRKGEPMQATGFRPLLIP